MIYCDSHVHTRNSPDGRDAIADIVRQAQDKGLVYLATTDHLDYDLKIGNNRSPIYWNHINLDKYRAEWLAAKAQLDKDQADKPQKMQFCFGIEAGFEDDERVNDAYIKTFERYPFDIVINSVHFVNGMDVYFRSAFLFKSKKRMYGDYLDKILRSLDAPYEYDTVAHIGYVTRNAPYRDKTMSYAEFGDKIDAILNGIIQRNKALEVNTHNIFTPSKEVLQRYYELGGRKITFASDSHHGDICKDYESTCALLKEIGFTHFSVFCQHKESLINIE